MPKQPAFLSRHDAMKTKRASRERFLAERDVVVPREHPLALIAPHHPALGQAGGHDDHRRAVLDQAQGWGA